MSKYKKYHGFILSKYEYKEKDIILNIFTKESGKIIVKAKGAKSKNSKNIAKFDLLNLIEFNTVEIKSYLTITDVRITDTFSNIRTSININYIWYLLEVISYSTEYMDNDNSEVWENIANNLHISTDSNFIKNNLFMLFKIVTYLGFEINFINHIEGSAIIPSEDRYIFIDKLSHNLYFSKIHRENISISDRYYKILKYTYNNLNISSLDINDEDISFLYQCLNMWLEDIFSKKIRSYELFSKKLHTIL